MKIFVLGTRGFPNIQGGAEKHCEQLYPFMSKEVEVTTFRRKPYVEKNAPKKWKNISFVDLPSTKIKGLEALFHSFLSAIYSIFKRPDIVHIHNIGPGLVTPLLRLFGIKVVVTYHSPNYEHKKWNAIGRFILRLGEWFSLKFANAVIFVNKFQMNKVGGMEPHKMFYIPNGVVSNNGEISSDKLAQWNLEPYSYIMAVGRITPEKGFDLLVSAHKKLNTDVKLVIVGAVEAEKKYFTSLKAIDNKNAIFLGFQSGEALKQLYQNARLFVLSSYNEGFPLVLLEAMSYNKPILASDIPASHLIELNPDDYFKCGDESDLIDKLHNKLNSPNDTKCTYSLDDYRWESVAKSTNSVYKSIIEKKRLTSIILFFVSLLLVSCSIDTDAKIEGRWQTTSIESPRHSLHTDSIFWSFDKGVGEIQTLNRTSPHYAEQIFANYLIVEDSIKISIPDKYFYLANKNRYLDWNTPERKFAIRELTQKSLKLSVNDTIYSFRKYY